MNKSRLLVISILLILVLLLVACGGSTSSGEIVVGNPAPDFTLTNTDGVQVSLSDYEGQPVLLFFHMAGG